MPNPPAERQPRPQEDQKQLAARDASCMLFCLFLFVFTPLQAGFHHSLTPISSFYRTFEMKGRLSPPREPDEHPVNLQALTERIG